MTSVREILSLRRQVLRDPVNFLAFGLGSGLAPRAPGTVGSMLGVALAWWTLPLGLELRFLVALALILSGIWICGESARRIGVHDHPGIVWDEITGYLATMLAAPAEWYWLLAGFVLFRFFEIWKPWPIREADHSLGGGVGIMLDDVLAAVYAGAVLYGLNSGF
jgi:phosphatidylglycerophosphatase A